VWVHFVLTSTLLGYFVSLLFYETPWQFFLQLCAGWLVGHLLTGGLLFATSYFWPLDTEHIHMIATLQVILITAIVIYLLKHRGSKFFIPDPEESPSFYFVLLLVSIFSFFYLRQIYYFFPIVAPEFAVPTLEAEVSFVNSLLRGPNRHRQNFFRFKNSMNLNSPFSQPTLPLLFAAACASLGAPFSDVSFAMNFLNILCTTAFLYFYGCQHTKHRFLYVVCYLFNSGWSLIRNVFSCTDTKPLPLKQYFLCFSKADSATIPLAILALTHSQSDAAEAHELVFGGFIAALIPDFATSIAVFGTASCFPNCLKTFLPFFVSIVAKATRMQMWPVWRECQMRGVFFSQIIVWLEAFGPAFLCVFCGFGRSDELTHSHLARVATLVLLSIVRVGNGLDRNGVAVLAVVMPEIVLVFIKNIFTRGPKEIWLRGMLKVIGWIVVAAYVASGLLTVCGAAGRMGDFVELEVFRAVGKKVARIPANATVLCRKAACRAALYFGKQIVIGNLSEVWKTGESVAHGVTIVRSIEQGADLVDTMQTHSIGYLLDMASDSFIPGNYSKVQTLKVISAESAELTLYKL
jgi:hypothetical protein